MPLHVARSQLVVSASLHVTRSYREIGADFYCGLDSLRCPLVWEQGQTGGVEKMKNSDACLRDVTIKAGAKSARVPKSPRSNRSVRVGFAANQRDVTVHGKKSTPSYIATTRGGGCSASAPKLKLAEGNGEVATRFRWDVELQRRRDLQSERKHTKNAKKAKSTPKLEQLEQRIAAAEARMSAITARIDRCVQRCNYLM